MQLSIILLSSGRLGKPLALVARNELPSLELFKVFIFKEDEPLIWSERESGEESLMFSRKVFV